jgi:tetratricopeptide (TPR) repeat protein
MVPFSPPTIADLTDRLLKRADVADIVEAGEVEPYEVLTGFRTDPRTAYNDALAPLKLLGEKNLPLALPPDWANFLQANNDALAVPMAAGFYPQQVRDLASLINGDFDLKDNELVFGATGLKTWAEKNLDKAGVNWFAAAILRKMGDDAEITGTDAVAQNETAAAMWQDGDREAALEMWLKMPDSAVANFNRGMAYLFLGHAELAMAPLRLAARDLPDQSGWNHLAGLYLAVAEGR